MHALMQERTDPNVAIQKMTPVYGMAFIAKKSVVSELSRGGF
jgi:hypothetical protein